LRTFVHVHEEQMSEKSRTRQPRASRGYRLSSAAIAKISREARAVGMTDAQYLEGLIMQSTLVETDYFAQQAAVNSFVIAALVASIAAKQLGVTETVSLRDRGAALAAQLFGAPRRRPGELGTLADTDDPRVLALFEAFGAR
jgi:hypothetical protein